jgi:hypothetical protein
LAAGECDEDLGACYCPSNTTYGWVPAPPDAPQGAAAAYLPARPPARLPACLPALFGGADLMPTTGTLLPVFGHFLASFQPNVCLLSKQ